MTGSKRNARFSEGRSNGESKQREGLSVWAFLAASILALPIAGVLRRFRWAAILSVIVLLECAVLAANGGRCPLSDWATRYIVDRGSNFDIFLPNWLAAHNKVVFGWLFVAGELVVVGNWLRDRFATQLRNFG
jgi:hypothetical protein